MPAVRRRRLSPRPSTPSIVVVLTAVLVATLGMTVSPRVTRATGELTVIASGGVAAGFGMSDTFSVAVRDDGTGTLSGSVHMTRSGSPSDGTPTCLAVNGGAIVIGAQVTASGPFGGDPSWFTLYLTDNGPTGTSDTVAFDGPTSIAEPDCGAAGPSQQALSYGQVTLYEGPSDDGTVQGQGTSPYGESGTRTFDFSAERLTDESVSGTYTVSETGGFSTSGTIDCVDIRGGHAMVIGHGPSPWGDGTLYATFFVDDVGPNGSGDLIAVNAYSGMAPTDCLAAPEIDGDPLITGDIDVNGTGGGSTPPPAIRVAAWGAVQRGPSQSDSFDVAVASDGAGQVSGTVEFHSASGSTVNGTVTCLGVSGDSVVVGALDPDYPSGGGGGSMQVYVTLYLTDNGPDGTTDTAAFDGPTNMAPPDCSSTSPTTEEPLWYGQITLLRDPSEPGQVSGSGTHDIGSGGYTRTFDFDATRDEGGTVTGTFSIQESPNGFTLSGNVDCLEIHGSEAMLIGHGPNQDQGSGTYYAAIFVKDGGAAGVGDSMTVNAYRGTAPFDCLAAQEEPGESLTSGDIVVGPLVGPLPTVADSTHPVIASVTSPGGGTVTVTESETNDPPPAGSGYTFVGHQLDITAPDASAPSPLILVFTVDAGLLASADPDLTADTIIVFRDGSPVVGCNSGHGAAADPNPCVSARETLQGGEDEGDARITVLSSHASSWNFGSPPDPDAPQYYGIAHALTSDFATAYVVNESGDIGGTLKSGAPARINGTTMTPLSGVSGYGSPYAINEAGTIVGAWDGKAVRFDGTSATILPGLGGDSEAAVDIDETGTRVIGTSQGSTSTAWLQDGTVTDPLPGLGGDYTSAFRFGPPGQIVGTSQLSSSTDSHLVRWVDGAIEDLGLPAGASYANPADVNASGVIVGNYSIPYVGDRAFIWQGAGIVDLPTLAGGQTFVLDLNDQGQAVGQSPASSGFTHAVVWEGGEVRDLGTLGGSTSYGSAINELGQIVGAADTAEGRQHGFLLSGGVMRDLNDLVPSDTIEITGADKITDSGIIVGSSAPGTVLLLPGVRPAAPYQVIDLGASLSTPGFDIGAADMNQQHQAAGTSDGQAFVFDGNSSSRIFSGSFESGAGAINELGEVAGSAQQGQGSQAYLYDGTTAHFLGTFGGDYSSVRDLNDAGEVVGSAQTGANQQHAYVYRDGAMVDLQPAGDTGSEAMAINNAGTVIGYTYDGPYSGAARGFIHDGTTTTEIPSLGGPMTTPYAINEAGEITGTSSTATQVNVAFRYADGTMTNIAPTGSTMSEAVAINEAGAIAGSYLDAAGHRYPFTWHDGTTTLIPGMGGSFATSTDINARGDVVGYATTQSSTRGYLFRDGDLVDLTSELPLGYGATITVARRISDDGAVLVSAQTPDYRTKALILIPNDPDPVPDPLAIDTSAPAPASVARYGRFEREFELSRSYGADSNDPGAIDVTARFVAPNGAIFTVPAWFGKDLTLHPGTGVGVSELYDPVPGTENGVWHVRFSPDEVGAWTYTLRARDHVSGQQTTVTSSTMSFQVTASSAKGQVERDSRDDRFLRFSDGTPYLPMGQNVAFGDGNPNNDGSHYFEPHFASMEAAGQNWVRVWMTDFYVTAIEWNSTHWSGQYGGVGQYGDVPAYRIEQVLDLAEQYGLEVQLVLNDHGQFSDYVNARWDDNPYNSANGGPVPEATPEAFFTDPTARTLFKQRLRYLVARYGAYRDILAWELFNETQWIGTATNNTFTSQAVRDSLVAWHAEMAAYLRSIDPYDHLITTSSDIDTSAAAIWDDPNIDLVQVHDYGALAGRDERFHDYAVDLNATYHKPVIVGEFGLSGSPEPGFDPTTSSLPADRIAHLVEGTHLHDSAWASAMSASGAMSWWWGNYIRDDASLHRNQPDFPLNERINPPLRDFFAGEDLAGMGLHASSITVPASVVALGLDNGTQGFAWVRDGENEYGSGVGPGDLAGRTMSNVTIGIDGFADGTYRLEVVDPWGVLPTDTSRLAVATGGTLSVPLPTFTRDLAIKIRPAGPAEPATPVVIGVTSPNGGPVTMTESATTDPPPVGSGYTFLGRQFDIDAPAASKPDPLTLVFTIDASVLASADPDLTAETLAIFRDGVPVAGCSTDTGDDPASPDPCVSARQTLSGGADDGDAQITVLTSHASTWNVGSLPAESVPGAPTGVTATRGNAAATVTWSAPSDDGGSAITGYTVTSSPGGVSAGAGGTATSVVVSGLTNGTTYTFTVTATNQVGTGPASAPSNAVTPQAPIAQTITFAKPANQLMTASPYTATATASSGLPVSLTSTTTAVCTASGLVITFVAAGTCTVTANQPGDDTYAPAAPVTRSFTVSQAAQSITFTNPGNKTMLQTPFTVSATASSGLPVTLTSTTIGVCTVSGFEITLVGPGSCSLTASQAGNAVYKAATSVTRTFTVSKVAQSITFTNPGNKTMLQTPFTVTATASSGLPVTVVSTTAAVCTVGGFQITLVGPGSCSLTASQAGDATYAAATSITRTFTVSKATQSITFVKLANATLIQSPITIAPTASSGLPVTVVSTTAAVCTVSGFQVTLLVVGTCTLTASQAGDTNYAAATSVSRSFSVTKAPQTITFPNPGAQSILVPTILVSPWASSDLPVTIASTTTGVCTNVGDTVTLKKAGTCKLKATQAGNTIYAAAPAVTIAFTVTASTPLPFVVASGTSLTVGGQPFTFDGAAIYNTSNPGGPNDPARIVAMATDGGLNSLRLVNMFDETTAAPPTAPTNAADWERIDRLIARARGAGLRVVLDLSAFRNFLVNRDIHAHGWEANCLPDADRSPVDYGAISPYRVGLDGEWQAFLSFVMNRLNTVSGVAYKDDATIAVVSVAGEPRGPGTEECGKAATTAELTAFFARTLDDLATIDPQHLHSTGGLGYLVPGGGGEGIDGEAIFGLTANTLPALHTYTDLEGTGTPVDGQTPTFGPLATSLGKPWFTEEFGWKRGIGDAARAERYTWLYDEQPTYGSDGAMFWNLGPETADGSHDVNPSSPLAWAVVRTH